MKKVLLTLVIFICMTSILVASCTTETETPAATTSPAAGTPTTTAVKTTAPVTTTTAPQTTAPPTTEPPKFITITDSTGRTVEIEYPVTRAIVVYSQLLLTMKAIGVEDEKIVGLDEYTYGQYEDIFTGLQGIPLAGKNLFNLDAEKIMAIDAQVLIGTPTTLSRMPELEEQLEKVGIKIIGLDFAMANVEDVIGSLGKMFGKEQEAKEYTDFWFSKLDLVCDRVDRIPDSDRVKVYWENTSTAYDTINKSSASHEIVVMGGGCNIAADIVGSTVDPEWVITQNPDVIMKYPMGSDYQGGFGKTDLEPFKEILAEINSRPGFDQIKAVQNGEVYIMSQIIKTGAFENVAICYIAKILYPELFEDLDPTAHLKEMVDKYLGLDWEAMNGVFVYPEPWAE